VIFKLSNLRTIGTELSYRI